LLNPNKDIEEGLDLLEESRRRERDEQYFLAHPNCLEHGLRARGHDYKIQSVSLITLIGEPPFEEAHLPFEYGEGYVEFHTSVSTYSARWEEFGNIVTVLESHDKSRAGQP
jgi:hypothetical protein